jgi:hypothetical protein
MTPKEKAEELVYKMHNVDFHDLPDELAMQYIHAKQCALIAVDEVQRLIKDLSSCNYRFIYIIDEMNFWNEVKQEIQKL